MVFPRQEYWSGLPFPPPGDLPDPGFKPMSPALAGGFVTIELPGKPSSEVGMVVSILLSLFYKFSQFILDFPDGTGGKKSACQCRRCEKPRLDPWVRKIPWRRKWQPTPVFLSGKSQGQRNLVGYSPWGHKESNTTE